MRQVVLRHLHSVELAVLILATSAGVSEAQSRSLFGSQGAVSRSASGGRQSGFSGLMGGGSQLGTSSPGGLSQGLTGGFGNGAAGQLGSSSGAFGQGARTGLVGRSDNTGRQVGTSQAGTAMNTRSNFSRGGLAGAANSSRLGLRNLQGQGQAGAQAQGGQRRSAAALQPQHRLAFDFPAPLASDVTQQLRVRFRELAPRTALGDVQIDFGGGQARLRGTVSTPEARRLAEQLVRLEPGVRSIQNEITVRN